MKSRQTSGFTLLEVMIAMLILGMGLLTLGMAQLSAMRTASQSESLSQAMYLAEQQFDLLYVGALTTPPAPGVTVDPGNPILAGLAPPAGVVADNAAYNRQWTVVPNSPQPRLSTVTIQVTPVAPEGGGGQSGQQAITLQGVVGPCTPPLTPICP